MNLIRMPELRFGELVAEKPIIQGGMGVCISLSGLASAVANEGGIGVIASPGIGLLEPDYANNIKKANKTALLKEIVKAKSMTNGLIGVNLMVALSDFSDLLLTAFDSPVDIIFIGAGLPLTVPRILTPEKMHNRRVKIVPIVSSARAAGIVLKSWGKYNCVPDAMVVEGPMAGGHLGFNKEQLTDPRFQLDNLVKEVMDAVQFHELRFGKKIPIIAAGGIYSGSDIYKYLLMGASGVQMATRFVATHECDADIKFKEAYVHAQKSDLIVIDSPVGLPGRALNNHFLKDVRDGKNKPFSCPWKCLRTCNIKIAPYCIANALKNAMEGKLEKGFAFAGANAYRISEITSVHDLMSSLEEEYNQVFHQNKTEVAVKKARAIASA